MEKKLLLLMGSPRHGGTISKMMEIVAAAARSKGWETDWIYIYNVKIAPCTGCMSCREHGRCIIQDDLYEIVRKLKDCNCAVIGAPVYFSNVPGPLKNLFDRLAGSIVGAPDGHVAKPLLRSDQRYILITACTTAFPFNRILHQSSGALRAMDVVFKTSGMRRQSQIAFAGSRDTEEIPEHIEKKLKKSVEKLT